MFSDVLKERLSIAESEKSEMERHTRSANEQTVTDHPTSTSRQAELEDLSKIVEILRVEKTKADNDLRHSRSRAQALQVELDNSEAVQRDFVKLSQSLQVSRSIHRGFQTGKLYLFISPFNTVSSTHLNKVNPESKLSFQ